MRIRREVDCFEAVNIGGVNQWLLVRGRSARLPLLLHLQGGPGMARIPEAGRVERLLGLEEHFLVAYWDQRAMGKSFQSGSDPAALTIARLIGDVGEMIDYLLRRYNKERLYLAGFSVGGSLAALVAARFPQALEALVAIGVDVNYAESEKQGYAFALAEAKRRHQARAIRELTAIGPPPHSSQKAFSTRVKWVANFGGILHGWTFRSMILRSIGLLLRSPHYSWSDAFRALRGMAFYQEHLLPQLRNFDLATEVPRLDVPVYFFQGRRDQAAPPFLAEKYYKNLDAPRGKHLIWFAEAAHMPHYECPDRFREEMLRLAKPGD